MPISNNIHAQTIMANTSLTESYVAADILSSADDYNLLGLEVLFEDNLTTSSLEIKVEESMDKVSYFQQTGEAVSGGTITMSVVERTFASPNSYALLIPIRSKFIKVSAKATGTTLGASITIGGYLTNREVA